MLKSFGFSVALFLFWGGFTVPRALSVARRFEWLEFGWVVYSALIAVLFLIRSRPAVVSLDPLHWLTQPLEVITTARVEPALAAAAPGQRFQFERLGYFCVDPDSKTGAPVFNRTVTLKDTWAKIERKTA